ncbi:pentapeptide repeat-containing protein [Actinosynnema sp. NPDC020468]|uniref:pentapeptide repeat-containing protein n=1 Tax=Actinosynnema sp. NPDC020468 TaxID=3154488 RepID=UPI0033E31296
MKRGFLLVSVLGAILVTAGTITLLLLLDPKSTLGESIKTGGLAGGAVVALYALWLNDRKRRTEEARHELESDKVADERFARSVELLGGEADQVRVGAMHALAGLARSTPRYRQTVLDVLCAYLRRPFRHPYYETRPDDPDRVVPRDTADVPVDVAQERAVRLTAQRLITDLLPWGQDADETAYHLDLTGATVEYLRLEGRRVGRLTARGTQFRGITALRGARFAKPALFTGATFHGRLQLAEVAFDGGVAFTEVAFEDEVDFRAATVGTFLALADVPPARQLGELVVAEGTALRTPRDGWSLRLDG